MSDPTTWRPTLNSKTSPTGIDLIKKFEGLKLTCYLCPAGIPTIGYGHTGTMSQLDVSKMTITEQEAEDLLCSDLGKFERAIDNLVKVSLTSNQFDALVSFVYNCGVKAFEKSTLLAKLNAKDFSGAADEFLKWNKVNGKTSEGLLNRRYAERNLFIS